MCVCDDGFVLENGKCIPADECGCNTPTGFYVENGYMYEDCAEKCLCAAGSYECISHTSDYCNPDCGCQTTPGM